MKRNKTYKRPDFLFLSDLHLREDTPTCRTDDFVEAQTIKLQFIKNLQKQWQCPVFIPGDLFHKWKSAPYLLAWAIENLPDHIIAIPGQHDLPEHSMEKLNKASIYVMEKAGKVKILSEGEYVDIATDSNPILVYGYPFGSKLEGVEKQEGVFKVALCHTLTYSQKIPYPGCTLDSAGQLLKKMSGFSLVIVGDNHLQFTATIGNRTLISPGSMSRQSADQIDFGPCCYAYYVEERKIEPIYLPIEEGVVSREHLERQEQRDGRIDAFVSRLNTEWESGVSFEENLERIIAENKVKDAVKNIIYAAIGE